MVLVYLFCSKKNMHNGFCRVLEFIILWAVNIYTGKSNDRYILKNECVQDTHSLFVSHKHSRACPN